MRDLIVPDRRILSRSLCVRVEKTWAPSSSLELQKNPGGICSAWTVAPCHHCPSPNFPWNQVILGFPWQAWVENLSQRWESMFLFHFLRCSREVVYAIFSASPWPPTSTQVIDSLLSLDNPLKNSRLLGNKSYGEILEQISPLVLQNHPSLRQGSCKRDLVKVRHVLGKEGEEIQGRQNITK